MENIEANKINEENIIYNELMNLSNSLSNYFSQDINNISYLIDFFNKISLEFKNFGNNIVFNKNSNFSFFYESQLSLIEKFKHISKLIKKEIIDPIILYKDSYANKNKDILFSLNEIMEEINNHQKILNNVKQNYFNNCQKLKNEKNEEDKNLLENNYYTIYFNEFDEINKILDTSENKYKNIKQKLLNTENEKNKFILNKINEYLKIINNEIILYTNDNNKISNQINIKTTTNNSNIKALFENNSILNKKWVQNIQLDLFNENNINMDFSLNNKNDYEIIINNNIINNFNNNKTNLFCNDKYFTKFQQFFLGLKSENNISNNLLKEINEIFENNKSNIELYEIFLSLFYVPNKKTNKDNTSLFIFKSFTNLVYLTNIINNIIEDIKDNLLSREKEEYYLIFEQIILIGENTIYDNTFMCSLLNRNKIFNNILIWKNSIFNKIVILLNIISKEFLNKEKYNLLNIKDIKDNIFNKEKYNLLNIKDIKDNIFKLALNKNKNNYKNNIELIGLNKYIKKYKDMSFEQKEYLNEKYNNSILFEVMKSYLRHMGNYNYVLDNPSDINDIILNDLNINNQEQIDFFINYYTVCINTIRKEKPKNIYMIKNKKIKEKILLIKKNKNKIINDKYPCQFLSDKSKFIILKNTSKYLNNEDNLKLIHLSKKYININKIFYKNLLKSNNIPIKNRINIWKSYLKCNTYSSIFNYNQLLSQIDKQQIIKENTKINEQIIKDLKRTKYRYKETLPALFNILRCFAYSNNIINYYQGMNLIALFLFELTKNEEETFIIINNLFCFTPFGDIIENEFQKLKIYYYVIERLIYLYLPKIYCHFRDNEIKVISFIIPYFITLFTNLYIYLPENELSFLLYVWDNFILNGWKSIFEIILTIFKYFEKKLISLKGDEILAFLGMELAKNELFLNKNLEEFCELKKLFKLNNELINLIEQEINIEMKMKSLTVSKIIENENKN